jgi:hypothetical protein
LLVAVEVNPNPMSRLQCWLQVDRHVEYATYVPQRLFRSGCADLDAVVGERFGLLSSSILRNRRGAWCGCKSTGRACVRWQLNLRISIGLAYQCCFQFDQWPGGKVPPGSQFFASFRAPLEPRTPYLAILTR